MKEVGGRSIYQETKGGSSDAAHNPIYEGRRKAEVGEENFDIEQANSIKIFG